MIYHSGFSIWWNSARNKWVLQDGNTVLNDYSTLRGAKIAATKRGNSL